MKYEFKEATNCIKYYTLLFSRFLLVDIIHLLYSISDVISV